MTRLVRQWAAILIAVIVFGIGLIPSPVSAQSEPNSRAGASASLAADQTPTQTVRRLYLAVYLREPDAEGLAFWAGQYENGTPLVVIANEFAKAPEFVQKYGSLDNTGFVNQLYQNVLDRDADQGGLDFWLAGLNSGRLRRGDVIVSFSESPEFRLEKSDVSALDRLYCAFFLRQADAGGREFWKTQYLIQARSLSSIAQDFTQVQEFVDTYGSLSDAEFVELIYQNVLGRDLPLRETAGPIFWTGELARGSRTRGKVMVGFSEAPEYVNRFPATTSTGCPEAGKADPIANDDSGTALFNTPVIINWQQNDLLIDGAALSSFNTTSVKGGTVANNGDGTFTFTPKNGFSGADSFTYTIADNDSPPATSTATVRITVLAVDDDGVPIANDDVASTPLGVPIDINWAANDVTSQTVDIQSVSATTAGGTVQVKADNTFTYTPPSSFVGDDTFTYTLIDNSDGDTSTATVRVTVRPSTDTNTKAVEDEALTTVNTPLVINVLANDDQTGGALTILDNTQPSHGVVTNNGDGTFTYTPDEGYEAETTIRRFVDDTFTYTVIDPAGATSTALVSVVVTNTPRCEIFMNYPFTDEGAPADYTKIELFFSSRACFALYPNTSSRIVEWQNVTLNGAPVGTVNGNTELREFIVPSAAALGSGRMQIAGTAVLKVDGATAISINFSVAWDGSGTSWVRDNSAYIGKGDAVTITINPLAS